MRIPAIPPLNSGSVIAEAMADNYYMYSGDIEWLETVWANYTKAVAFLEGKVDSTGLMDVTGLRDWARQGGGGHNAEGNAILYKVSTSIYFFIHFPCCLHWAAVM